MRPSNDTDVSMKHVGGGRHCSVAHDEVVIAHEQRSLSDGSPAEIAALRQTRLEASQQPIELLPSQWHRANGSSRLPRSGWEERLSIYSLPEQKGN